jgi:hypothetical protein
MRDLLFKHLTSTDRKKKVIASSEIADREGVRTIIRRHFVCLAREVKDACAPRPLPYLYVLKAHNGKQHQERFFCRMKGSIYCMANGKIYLVLFMHSLKVELIPAPVAS